MVTSPPDERQILSTLVAHELTSLGFPAQRFDIQASYLIYSPTDLAIRLVWPLRMPFQEQPTGVIQMASKTTFWKPESRVVIVFAKAMSARGLRAEIREWCRVQADMVRTVVEAKGGEWPREWPRLRVTASRSPDED